MLKNYYETRAEGGIERNDKDCFVLIKFMNGL